MRLKAPQLSESVPEIAQPDPGLSLEASRQEPSPALTQSAPPQALQDQAHSQLAPRLQGHYSADDTARIGYAAAQVAHQEAHKGTPEGFYASPDKERLAIKYPAGITERRIADLLQQSRANAPPQQAVQGTGPWSAHSYQNELDKQSQAWVEANGPGRVSRISLVKVQSGDTLSQLSGTHNPQTLDRTAQYNQLASRHHLAAGSTIAIPDAGILQTVPVSDAVAQKGELGANRFAQRQADATAQERQAVAEQTAPAANTIPPAGMSGATEVLTAQHKEKASNDSYASAQSSESGMVNSTKRAISDMATRVADLLTPETPTPQELQRGREVAQINRAFEKAKEAGDIEAMKSLHGQYQQVMADSPTPSMMNVPMGNSILRAQTNAQAGWDKQTLIPMAQAAMSAGISGVAPGPRVDVPGGLKGARGQVLVGRDKVFADGIAFELSIPAHITKLDGFSQAKGITGAHNLDAFMDAAVKNNVKIVSNVPGDVAGISKIKYQIPAVDKAGNSVFDASGNLAYKNADFTKTVYDPKVISDRSIIDLGQLAASSGYASSKANGLKPYNAEAGGISFRIYPDSQTGLIKNFHPR